MLAHKYKYETPMTDYVDLTIYEKNRKSNFGPNYRMLTEPDDVGGTWLENRYPGVACDVSLPGVKYRIMPRTYFYSGSCTYLHLFICSQSKYVCARHSQDVD